MTELPGSQYNASKLYQVRMAVIIALLLHLMVSPGLWHGYRDFPTVPVFPFLHVPQLFSLVVLSALIVGLAVLTAVRSWQLSLCALAAFTVLVLLDINRLSEGTYVTAVLLVITVLADSGKVSPVSSLHAARLVLLSSFFYGGLAQVNPYFNDGLFPWMITSWLEELGLYGYFPVLLQWWFMLPLLQIVTFLLLIYRKTARAGLYAGTFYALLMLLIWSPFTLSFNPYQCLWHLLRLVLLWLLFPYNRLWSTLTSKPVLIVLLLFWLCPLGKFFGVWDTSLSFATYSGRHSQAYLVMEPYVWKKVPPLYRKWGTLSQKDRRYMLHLDAWCWSELKVPVHQEQWVYRRCKEHFEKYADHPADVTLVWIYNNQRKFLR